jgi:hypothetical protein
MTTKLHIYLRVSSAVQMEDGFGIENQKELGLKVSKIQKELCPKVGDGEIRRRLEVA